MQSDRSPSPCCRHSHRRTWNRTGHSPHWSCTCSGHRQGRTEGHGLHRLGFQRCPGLPLRLLGHLEARFLELHLLLQGAPPPRPPSGLPPQPGHSPRPEATPPPGQAQCGQQRLRPGSARASPGPHRLDPCPPSPGRRTQLARRIAIRSTTSQGPPCQKSARFLTNSWDLLQHWCHDQVVAPFVSES